MVHRCEKCPGTDSLWEYLENTLGWWLWSFEDGLASDRCLPQRKQWACWEIILLYFWRSWTWHRIWFWDATRISQDPKKSADRNRSWFFFLMDVQYYKNMLNLCRHKDDFGIDATWVLFATSHGKSPCDGIGSTVKRLTARANLQRPYSD